MLYDHLIDHTNPSGPLPEYIIMNTSCIEIKDQVLKNKLFVDLNGESVVQGLIDGSRSPPRAVAAAYYDNELIGFSSVNFVLHRKNNYEIDKDPKTSMASGD